MCPSVCRIFAVNEIHPSSPSRPEVSSESGSEVSGLVRRMRLTLLGVGDSHHRGTAVAPDNSLCDWGIAAAQQERLATHAAQRMLTEAGCCDRMHLEIAERLIMDGLAHRHRLTAEQIARVLERWCLPFSEGGTSKFQRWQARKHASTQAPTGFWSRWRKGDPQAA